MQDILDQHRQQGKKTIAFINTDLLKHMSHESKKELFSKLAEHELKVYQTSTASELLKYSKPLVVRYGHIPDVVSRKITLKGGIIVAGNL